MMLRCAGSALTSPDRHGRSDAAHPVRGRRLHPRPRRPGRRAPGPPRAVRPRPVPHHPAPNDHSAYDAYSLLVEADSGRLFYTGDIRGHGRKARLFTELLDDPPSDVDVLLTEGTNLRAAQQPKPAVTEAAVEQAMTDVFTSTPGMALVAASAQNIDRLVTINRATLRADRDLVMDAYTADVARATGNDNIPRPPEWGRIHTRACVPRVMHEPGTVLRGRAWPTCFDELR